MMPCRSRIIVSRPPARERIMTFARAGKSADKPDFGPNWGLPRGLAPVAPCPDRARVPIPAASVTGARGIKAAGCEISS
jgi:hypothetical protein